MSDKTLYPKMLNNEPCGSDLFEGKSQDVTAEVISDVLRNNERCQIIGVDGGWGSGKSNLVEIVKSKLKDEKNSKFHFFIYDAWGHQEDDLQRRSILEELTENIKNLSCFDSNKWETKKKELFAKKRVVETKSIPSLSLGVIFAGIAIILTPILTAIAENFYCPWNIIITSIPFFLIGFVFVLSCIKAPQRGFKEKIINTLNRFFYLYNDRQTEEITSETISEEEPSVREFRNWMQDISNDLKGQKLILVFDNMDRLPKEKIQELWSSIHIFFADIECKKELKNIHVIIPFDRLHIKSAFTLEDGKNFGDDFINKTFDRIYRVSPPILSDWKNYFKLKWEEAFGLVQNEDKEEYKKVVQIFDLLSTEITPRKIIAFINNSVSIKQTLQYEIPYRYITLFILGRSKIFEKPDEQIINPEYLGNLEFLYKNDENLPKYIASIFYQIDPEKAIQVIFTDKLRKAFDNNDTKFVEGISKMQEFSSILENAITKITNCENATLALNSIPIDKVDTHIWNCLYPKIIPCQDQKIKEYQKILLSKISNREEYLQKIINEFLSDKNVNDFVAKDYYESINTIDKEFANLNVFSVLREYKTSTNNFISLVELTKNDYSRYKISCDEDELDRYFAEQVVDTVKIQNINIVQYIVPIYPLNNLKAEIERLISYTASAQNQKYIENLFELYKEFNQKPLKHLLNDDIIVTYFKNKKNNNEEFYYDLLAMRLAKLGNFPTNYSSHFNTILQETDTNIVEEIAERIEFYTDYGNILLGLETFDCPLLRTIAMELTNHSYGESRLNIIAVIRKFDTIVNKGIDSVALIKRLNAWSTDSLTKDNIINIVTVLFIESILKVNCNLSKHCLKCLKEYFENLDTNNWEEIFKDTNSHEFNVNKLLDNRLPHNAFEAVKQILKEIAIGDENIPDKKIWGELIEKLRQEKRSLAATFNDIRDIFCMGQKINAKLFHFFGDWLFKYSTLSDKKETLRTIFTSEVLQDANNLTLIIENKDKMPTIIKNAGDEASDFIETIKEIGKTNKESTFIDFAKSIGVTFQEKEESDKKNK